MWKISSTAEQTAPCQNSPPEMSMDNTLRPLSSDAVLAGSTAETAHRSVRRRKLTVAPVGVVRYQLDSPSSRQAAHSSTSRALFPTRLTISPEVVVYSTLPQVEESEKDPSTRATALRPRSCTPTRSSPADTSDTSAAETSRACKLFEKDLRSRSCTPTRSSPADTSDTSAAETSRACKLFEKDPSTRATALRPRPCTPTRSSPADTSDTSAAETSRACKLFEKDLRSRSCTPSRSSLVDTSDTSAAEKSHGCKLDIAPMEIQNLCDSCLGFEDYSTTQCMHTISTSLLTETSECAHVQSSSSATESSSIVLPSTLSDVISTCGEDKDTNPGPSTSFADTLKTATPTKASETSFQKATSSANENLQVPLTEEEKADMAVQEDLDILKQRMVWLAEGYEARLNRRNVLKRLLERTRAEAQNLKAHVRSDAGDSWFKSMQDPPSVIQLLRRQEVLIGVLTKMKCEVTLLRVQHCFMIAVQHDAEQHIMAARRRRESIKMAAEDKAAESGMLEDFQDPSKEKQ